MSRARPWAPVRAQAGRPGGMDGRAAAGIGRSAGLAAACIAAVLASAPACAADTVPLVVRPGDTLDGLSRELLLQPGAWRRLASLNGLQQPDVLHPGQVLRLPAGLLRQQPVPATVLAVTGDVTLWLPARLSAHGVDAGSGSGSRAGERAGEGAGAQARAADRPAGMHRAQAGKGGVRDAAAKKTDARSADETVAAEAPAAGLRATVAPLQVLAVGQTVPEGAHISVGPRGSAVLRLADGSRVKLLPDSVASLAASRVAGARASAAASPVSAVSGAALVDASMSAPVTAQDGWFVGTMRLLRGSMEVLASKALRAKPLEVQTPTTVLGVRGTHYRVHLAELGAGAQTAAPQAATGRPGGRGAGWLTITEVLEGRVAAGAATVLSAGQGARVAAQGRPAVSPLPPAPDLSALPARFERPLVSWSAPADAAVRVQVAGDAGFDAIVLDQQVAAGAPVHLDGLADGIWHVRMRRIDAAGLAGPDAVGRFELDARPEPPPTVAPRPASKHPVGAVAFAWAEALGAESYALEIARDAAFTQRVARVDAIQGSGHVLDLPEAGRYHWRVRAIGPQDDRGPWGDAQVLDVRPDPLPPQTRHDADGSLVLTWGRLPGSEQAGSEQAGAPPPGASPGERPSERPSERPREPQPRWQAELASDEAFQQLIARVDLDEPQWRLPPPRWGRAVAPGVAAEGLAYFRYRTIEPDGYVSRPSQVVRVSLPRDPVAPWLLLTPLLFGL